MLLIILRYILGYVKVEINGFAPERFLNLITKNEIVTWDVINTENGYIFFTGRKNLIKMKEYLQKTNVKLKILKKYGLPYFIRQNKKRVSFLFGFMLFFFIIYILSLFVWEVKVTGENKLVAESILKEIDEKYVSLGTLKSKINCSDLEDSLRKDFKEISWISCELKGTSLTIHLEEGILPKDKEKEKVPGDLVAVKDAIITKMITRQGTPIVKVKQKIKKGDILISGTVYIYDDNNEVIETNYITADGDIYGKTQCQYNDYLDLKYYQKIYQDKSKKYITFYFGDYCFTPFIPKMKEKNYDNYTQIHKAKIFHNFYLPFGYKVTQLRPYKLEAREYKVEEARKILEERLKKNLNNFEKKGVEIIKNNVKIEKDNNRMIAKGKLILLESISAFKQSSNNTTIEKKEK